MTIHNACVGCHADLWMQEEEIINLPDEVKVEYEYKLTRVGKRQKLEHKYYKNTYTFSNRRGFVCPVCGQEYEIFCKARSIEEIEITQEEYIKEKLK